MENNERVGYILAQLYDSKLGNRLHALQECSKVYERAVEDVNKNIEVKVGPLKRIAVEIVCKLLTGYDSEKKWKEKIIPFFELGIQLQTPLFNFEETVLEAMHAKIKHPIHGYNCVLAFRVLSIFLLKSEFVNDFLNNERVTHIIQLQGDLIEIVGEIPGSKGERFRKLIKNAAKVDICRGLNVFQTYVSIWSNEKHKLYLASLVLLHELQQEISSLSTDNNLRSVIISKFITISTKQPTDSVFARCTLFVKTITAEEWRSDQLEGHMLRQIKKAPELSASLVNYLVQYVNADFSHFLIEGGITFIPRIMKSTNDSTRAISKSLLQNILLKCSNVESVIKFAKTILDIISGKVAGTSLPSPALKLDFLAALSQSAIHLQKYGTIGETFAIENFPFMIAVLEKEVDDDVRYAITQTLSTLLNCCTTIHKSVTDNIFVWDKKKLSNINPNVNPLLLVVTQLCNFNQTDYLIVLESNVPHLSKIVQDAIKKPTTLSVDGLLALSLLSRIHTRVGVKDFSAVLQATLINESSFLYSAPMIKFLSASLDSSVQHHSLARDVLSSFLYLVAETCNNQLSLLLTENNEALNLSMTYYLVMSILLDSKVGSFQRQQFQSINNVIPNPLFNILKNYFQLLCIQSENKALHAHIKTIVATDSEEAVVQQKKRVEDLIEVSTSHHISAIVKVIVGDRTFSSLHSAIYLALLLSNSVVNGSSEKRGQKLFDHLIEDHLVPSDDQEMDKESIVDYFLKLLQSSSNTVSEGSLQSLNVLYYNVKFSTQYNGSVLDSVMKKVQELMQSSELYCLSPDEINVAKNPNYLIEQAEKNIKSINLDDIKITNADRKKTAARSTRKGNFGNDFIEDEAWAEQIKKEKAKKLLEQQKQGSENVECHELEKRTLDIQAKLKHLMFQMERLLFAVEFFAVRRHPAVSTMFYQIESSILSLFSVEVVVDKAFHCLKLLCDNYIDPSLQSVSSKVAYALKYIRLLEQNVSGDPREIYPSLLSQIELIEDIVKEMHLNIVCYQKEVNLETFYITFPIYRSVLLQNTLPPGCEYAFLTLVCVWFKFQDRILHVARSPLKQMIEICLFMIPKYRSGDMVDPSEVLVKIFTTVKLTTAEWIPVVGSTGLLNDDSKVRAACLKSMFASFDNGILSLNDVAKNPLLVSRLWFATCYEEDDIHSLAHALWTRIGVETERVMLASLLPLLSNESVIISKCAGRAIARDVGGHLAEFEDVISSLLELFVNSKVPKDSTLVPPVLETSKSSSSSTSTSHSISKHELVSFMSGGLKTQKPQTEDLKWTTRLSIAEAVTHVAILNSLNLAQKEQILQFILSQGVIDSNEDVREAFLQAGIKLVDNFGSEHCENVIVILQSELAKQNPQNEPPEEFDRRKEAAVVFLGCAGKHLNKEDPNVVVIMETLLKALDTPVERIQRSVADCLANIITVLKGNAVLESLIERILNNVLHGDAYGIRRGAAYGLSASIKGIGISSIKQHDIINRLKDVCNTGSVNSRQGALFAFELMSERLGLLFEPYVISIIPILLKCFSHTSDHVRDAARAAAKVIMGKLSGHGVKQVLTPIISSLPDEKEWKSRQEALRLLGTMAYCAPKQLASCLPQVIPSLVNAGSDPHPKVKETAKQALVDISSVIKNPEIQTLSPILLGAISDPSNKTKEALEALLQCEFMHSIDAPSLALLVPVLNRALRDRGGDLKRKSTAIIGNISSMISDPKILSPYLPQLIPGLQSVLLDPIPDVRATCAKAFGGLIEGVGEESLGDIVPWLKSTIQSDASPVERSGAAQGLAEIAVRLGPSHLKSTLEDLLKLQRSSRAPAREGLQWFFSFLAVIAGEMFVEYISVTMPIILTGLCDENEGVREVALRSGQVIVKNHGRNNCRFILPPLVQGLSHEDWRIRQNSITLMGDLLYLVGDTKAVGLADHEYEVEDDDEELISSDQLGGRGQETVFSRVITAIRVRIGEEQTDFLLATVYIARFDTNSAVRQVALQVWKSIVNNTPSILRHIMPVLVRLMISKLSSEDQEQRTIAGRALADLVRKLGDFVLPTIVPFLEEGLLSPEDSFRQGVCHGLSEILSAASSKQIETYIDTLVPALHIALCDKAEDVRSLAAQAFHSLMKSIGPRAMNDVIPILLDRIQSGGTDRQSQYAMQGLRQLVALKSRDTLNFFLPILLQSPMSVPYVKTLGAISAGVGHHLHYHYSDIFPKFVEELIANDSKDVNQDVNDAIKACCSEILSNSTTSGVNAFVIEIGRLVEAERPAVYRKWGCWLAAQFFAHTTAEYHEYLPIFLKHILSRSSDLEEEVLKACLEGMVAINAAVPIETLSTHMDFIRSCISLTASEAKHRTGKKNLTTEDGSYMLPLLSLPKSLEPFLNIYLHLLINGSAQAREDSATALCELLVMTDAAVLKPYLIKTTGPLIRVIGDRHPSSVKNEILGALTILLDKGGAGLKAFVPQLQTTFVKSLSDPYKQVRTKAALALGKLMPLTTRVDPLVNELASGYEQAEGNAIKSSYLEALYNVFDKGGDKITPVGFQKAREVVTTCILSDDESIRQSAAQCIGSIIKFMAAAQVTDLLIDLSSSSGSGENWTSLAGRLLGSCAALRAAGWEKSSEVRPDAINMLKYALQDDRANIKIAACNSLELLFTSLPYNLEVEAEKLKSKEHVLVCEEIFNEVNDLVLGIVNKSDSPSELRRAAVNSIKLLAKSRPAVAVPHALKIISALKFALAPNEMNLRYKRACERSLKNILGLGPGGAETKQTQNVYQILSTSSEGVALSQFARDYSKRFLNKLSEQSDDEL